MACKWLWFRLPLTFLSPHSLPTFIFFRWVIKLPYFVDSFGTSHVFIIGQSPWISYVLYIKGQPIEKQNNSQSLMKAHTDSHTRCQRLSENIEILSFFCKLWLHVFVEGVMHVTCALACLVGWGIIRHIFSFLNFLANLLHKWLFYPMLVTNSFFFYFFYSPDFSKKICHFPTQHPP